MGIRAKQRFCNDLFSLAACLIQGEDFGWSDLALPLAATLVCVALIVGFAARLPDFQQKPTLRHVEIVELSSRAGTQTARRTKPADKETIGIYATAQCLAFGPTKAVSCTFVAGYNFRAVRCLRKAQLLARKILIYDLKIYHVTYLLVTVHAYLFGVICAHGFGCYSGLGTSTIVWTEVFLVVIRHHRQIGALWVADPI